MIQKALVILTKTVVMLIVGRRKRSTDLKELRIGEAAIIQNLSVSVLVIRHRLRPALHVKQSLAIWRAEEDMGARSRSVKESGDIQLRLHRL